MQSTSESEGDSQDNFIEARDPSELVMCIILAAAYAGLARYCWEPLQKVGNWQLLFNLEGFFVCISLLALLVGLRPYYSPCNLQVSKKGIKYQGPYWPQRKTVNWSQVFKLYLSPELVVVLYHPGSKGKGIWPLFIQTVYLADRDRVIESIRKYSPVSAVMLHGPSLSTRLLLATLFVLIVIWILQRFVGGQ